MRVERADMFGKRGRSIVEFLVARVKKREQTQARKGKCPGIQSLSMAHWISAASHFY